MKKLILLTILLVPFLLVGQTESVPKVDTALAQNNLLIDQFAQIAPMSINPYTSVFLTSVCSKAGFHNDYVSTNPFYDNWFIVVVFGVLFFFTSIIGTVISSNKVTAPIKNADNYLQNYAGPIINAIIMLTPIVFTETPQDNEIVYHAGIISISFKTLLILVVSTYMLFVIMTMRLFIDFLIFLSPIPFVDAGLEIMKVAISIILVITSIISPITTVVITLVMFAVSLLFVRRAKKLISKVEYLLIYPILNTFRKKEDVLTNGESLSILVFTKSKTQKLKKGNICRLEKRGAQFFLVKRQFLFSNKEEEIILSDPTLSQTHLDILLTCNGEIKLILNRSYHRHIDEISEILGAEIVKRSGINLNLNKGVFYALKNMFNKSDIDTLKAT